MEQFSAFIIGAMLGSFFNMLIYRLPLGISLVNPKRSSCPTCGHTIKWYENIPIISYTLVLRGKCGGCKEKIPSTYLIVELITASVSVLIYNHVGFSLEYIPVYLLFYTLIILSFIDLKFKAVPDYLLIIVLILAMAVPNVSFASLFMFAGGIVLLELFVTYYIQNIKARIVKDDSLKDQRSMGEGDIPIVAVIGGLLGIKLGIAAMFLAALFAIIPSLINSFIKKDMETPFIPFLALGLFTVYIFQNQINNLIGSLF
ncbi:MAG: prepilin peptidase [Campylobacterota bacterium]|nr:prepilin peptidase [Campylobacterota bacterium]